MAQPLRTKVVAALFCLTAISACGQKGDLYQPEDDPKKKASYAPTATQFGAAGRVRAPDRGRSELKTTA